MSPLPSHYPSTVDLPFNSACLAGRFTPQPPDAALSPNCRRPAVSPAIFSISIWGILTWQNRRGGSRTALLSHNKITGGQFMNCPYSFYE